MLKKTENYWDVLSSTDFVFEENCWQTCESVCCEPVVPGGVLRFPQTWVFYMFEEFKYFEKKEQIPLNKSKHKELSVELGNGVRVGGLCNQCNHQGRCKDKMTLPLFCKLCPFLPVMDIDGKFHDIELLNLIDLTVEQMNFAPRCSIVGQKEKYLNMWKNSPGLLRLLSYPYTLFHLLAAKITLDNYKKTLLNNPKILKSSSAAFWSSWELELITGRLFDKEQLRIDISKLCDEFTEEHGRFPSFDSF